MGLPKMIGKLKVLESSKPEIIRPKLSVDDVTLHFSGLNEHKLSWSTAKTSKEYIVTISCATIEAKSLLIIGCVSKEGNEFFDFSDVEFRFYPKI